MTLTLLIVAAPRRRHLYPWKKQRRGKGRAYLAKIGTKSDAAATGRIGGASRVSNPAEPPANRIEWRTNLHGFGGEPGTGESLRDFPVLSPPFFYFFSENSELSGFWLLSECAFLWGTGPGLSDNVDRPAQLMQNEMGHLIVGQWCNFLLEFLFSFTSQIKGETTDIGRICGKNILYLNPLILRQTVKKST